jgi:hypothetical protein
MFNNKIKLLDDKQYYYESNATGMNKKGVKMDLLWFKQVPRIILILKIIFSKLFYLIQASWNGDTILTKFRG